MTASISFLSVQQKCPNDERQRGIGQRPIAPIAFGSVVRQYVLVRVCGWLLTSQ